ncbi:hypothetical protein D9M68_638200 [compost metagenome]
MRDIGVQAVVDGFAPARGQVFRHDLDAGPDRVAVAAQLVHIGFEFRDDLGIGRVERIVGDFIPGYEGDGDRAELAHVAADLDAILLGQPFLGDGARGHGGCGQARRRTAAAARVAHAELAPIGVIGMARPEGIGNVGVVLAARVRVADQQADRRARRHPFIHPG